MDLTQLYRKLPKPRHLLIGLAIWWLVMGLTYIVLATTGNPSQSIDLASAVALIKKTGRDVSLPLLERDLPSLQRLLTDSAKDDRVLSASLSDHQNKLIAATGVDKIIRVPDHEIRTSEEVSYWEGKLVEHETVTRLNTFVDYGGIRIGELTMTLAGAVTDRVPGRFLAAAVLSFLCMLLVVGLLSFSSGKLRELPRGSKWLQRVRSARTRTTVSHINCPLCGTPQPVCEALFDQNLSNEPRRTDLCQTATEAGRQDSLHAADLRQLARNSDLQRFRRRVVLRCAEIIQKLTV